MAKLLNFIIICFFLIFSVTMTNTQVKAQFEKKKSYPHTCVKKIEKNSCNKEKCEDKCYRIYDGQGVCTDDQCVCTYICDDLL
ncbi:hypothetical protein P3S67_022242 [Capsicum chacoense]